MTLGDFITFFSKTWKDSCGVCEDEETSSDFSLYYVIGMHTTAPAAYECGVLTPDGVPHPLLSWHRKGKPMKVGTSLPGTDDVGGGFKPVILNERDGGKSHLQVLRENALKAQKNAADAEKNGSAGRL